MGTARLYSTVSSISTLRTRVGYAADIAPTPQMNPTGPDKFPGFPDVISA
jgi:hypothetical protein